jgi:hypothetical protein
MATVSPGRQTARRESMTASRQPLVTTIWSGVREHPAVIARWASWILSFSQPGGKS